MGLKEKFKKKYESAKKEADDYMKYKRELRKEKQTAYREEYRKQSVVEARAKAKRRAKGGGGMSNVTGMFPGANMNSLSKLTGSGGGQKSQGGFGSGLIYGSTPMKSPKKRK